MLLLMLTLNACTAKLSYRFIDWVVAWRVAEYVQWNRAQDRIFQKKLREQIDWHRTTQLPLYSDFLSTFKNDLSKPLVKDELLSRVEAIEKYGDSILRHVTPDAIELLAQLDDAQVKKLLAKLQKDIKKLEEEYAESNQKKRHKKRVGSVKKSVSRFIGALNNCLLYTSPSPRDS